MEFIEFENIAEERVNYSKKEKEKNANQWKKLCL